MDAWLERNPRFIFLVPLLTALAIGIFYLRVVNHFDYTPDDTYIYLRTALNVVQGEGWSFNPGGPSYSVTGPLWAMLIAGGAALGLDPYIVAKSLDATLSALAILALQLLVFSLTEDRVLAASAAVLATFDALLVRWAGSGMETSLAVLLTILVMRYVIDDEWHIAGAALGLLVLVRPEYGLLAPWLVVATRDRGWGLHLRRWVLPLAVMSALVAVWWSVAAIWTGTMLSTTIGSKSGWWFDAERTFAALFEGGRIIAASQGISVLVLAALAFAIPRGADPVRTRWWRLLLGWPFVLIVAYASQGVQIISRYLLPASILLTAAMMLAISMWLESRPGRLRRATVLVLAAGVLSMALNTAVYELRVAQHLRYFTAGMEQAMKPIAFWLRANSASDDDVLAPDIGMIGYISERRIWDHVGLATPALREAIKGYSYDEVMQRRLYRSVVNPHYVVDRSRDRERLTDSTLRPIMTFEMPGLGVTIPGTQYVTLYEAVR
ncbi:MAG: hypothetical protein MUE68_11090 [Bacteroidetes bacterium]|jgi:hypothetical protein|nr:hypothetical protein [Bacteroidota bacterium]